MEGSRRPGGGTPRSDRRSCGLWLTGSWSRCRRTAAARGRRSACHLLCAPRGAEVPCAATRTSPQEWGAGGWPNDCHGALAAMQRRVRSRPSDEMTSSAVTVGLLDRGTSCGRRRGAVPAPGRTLVAESVGSQWAPAYSPDDRHGAASASGPSGPRAVAPADDGPAGRPKWDSSRTRSPRTPGPAGPSRPTRSRGPARRAAPTRDVRARRWSRCSLQLVVLLGQSCRTASRATPLVIDNLRDAPERLR